MTASLILCGPATGKTVGFVQFTIVKRVQLTFMIRLTVLFLSGISLFAQAPGSIQTIAGTGSASLSGDGGPANLASLNTAVDISADRAGNLFIADQFNHRIRKIAPDGVISTVVGTGSPGSAGDGGPARNAQLNTPTGIYADSTGNLFIADVGNQRIRKVDSSGIITTLAGNGSRGYGGDGGLAINASLYNPVRVSVDAVGNVLIADQSNHRIRRITPAGNITTIAGNGTGTPASGAFSGDGGPAASASLNNPTAVAVDASGVVYFSDQFNHRIRRIAVDGTITTIAGNGAAAFAGDGGPAVAASLNYPGGITVDAAGNLYFNDDVNYRARRIAPNGTISTIAGSGVQGFSGDGGPATAAALNGNFGIAVDVPGNIYIADSANHRIRKVMGAPSGSPSIRESNSVLTSFQGNSGFGSNTYVEIYGSNFSPNSRLWAGSDFTGANAPTSLDGVSVTVNGKPAFIYYISPTQININTPDDTATGPVSIQVKTASGLSNTVTATRTRISPALQTTPQFNIGGKQYVVALTPDFKSFIGTPGMLAGVSFLAAKPGTTVSIYALGCGPTNPPTQAGVVAAQASTLAMSYQLRIGGVPATVTFGGGVAQTIGLTQFNVVIPAVPAGDQPIELIVDGVSNAQNLVITIGQ